MTTVLLAFDIGTTSTRAVIYSIDTLKPLHCVQKALQLHTTQPQHVEQCPTEIVQKTLECGREVLKNQQIAATQVAGIGITNQRETTLVWERATGKPIYPAIVWQDQRTAAFCQQLKQNSDAASIRADTGLPLDAYFSASKLHWILKQTNLPAKSLCFGTVDCYFLWQLTQGKSHKTEATNASRTLLFNINTQQWDTGLLNVFDVDPAVLPEVCDTISDFGHTEPSALGASIPVLAMVGDQQAALIGQGCLTPGDIKCTFGTGTFAVAHAGKTRPRQNATLLTTVAYRIDGVTSYAIEGAIFNAGSALSWLKKQLQLFQEDHETIAILQKTPSSEGVVFIPAFSGLGAPFWCREVDAALLGLTLNTTRAQIVRAAFEGIAFQTAALLQAMSEALSQSGVTIKVDGGLTNNTPFLQLLSDTMNATIACSEQCEMTARGAALLTYAALTKKPIEKVANLIKYEHIEPKHDSNYKHRQTQWQRWINHFINISEQ